MSGFPSEIPDFGSVNLVPRQTPGYAPGQGFTTEDYYVFSRCDGRATARDIILMVGLGVDKGCAIMGKLRKLGAVLLPGETASPSRTPAETASPSRKPTETASPSRKPTETASPSRKPTETASPKAVAPRPSRETLNPGSERPRAVEGERRRRPSDAGRQRPDPSKSRTPSRDVQLGALSPEESAALAEAVALSEGEKLRVLELVRLCERADYFQLLAVEPDVDRKELKRAYFKLAKEFHPDRYYKKPIGPFAPWLTRIFETITRAFEVLNDDKQRAAYRARLRGEVPTSSQGSQSRIEHAVELFDRACALENRGQLDEAMATFAAAVRADPQPRFMRRAAHCCLAAGKLALAEEYASQGRSLRPGDAAYARILAEVYRVSGKLGEAESTLVRALELDTDNDALVGELRADLAAVRAAQKAADR